ncbi:MAG: MBL fold metallo-hydrolase [Patescibacteria group bacterium]
MKLTFYGGARMVTGANYLLESADVKILIDCGLHQGSSFCEALNWEPFPYKPSEIQAVFLTHAHIDHIGRLPKLWKDGFRGKIYSTPPTKDFAELLLLDSEHILREEAKEKNKPPLYGTSDVIETMKLWRKVSYHEKIRIGSPGSELEISFYDAGHILGSSSILISAGQSNGGKKIVFSGDLGNSPAPFIKPTEYFENADYVLIESAYGGRFHEDLTERKAVLEDLIEETVRGKGVLLIPAFALERTQEMIFELNELAENGRIPSAPIFIDSPLAIKLTTLYQKYSAEPDYFNAAAIKQIRSGDAIFNFPGLKMTLTTEESKAINEVPPPKIIVAGAGMSNGGRILHHERRYLSDPKTTILFIGYQAVGSLGRRIMEGAKTVKIFGDEIPVRAKIKAIGGFSAHADQPQLLKWLEPMRGHLKKVFVIQGEEEQSLALAQKIKDELAIEAITPSIGETVVL